MSKSSKPIKVGDKVTLNAQGLDILSRYVLTPDKNPFWKASALYGVVISASIVSLIGKDGKVLATRWIMDEKYLKHYNGWGVEPTCSMLVPL